VQSYLFDKGKWDLEKAKAWFEKHREGLVKEHFSAILPFTVLEKIVDKPLRIRGVAVTAGMSRNFNIYTSEELQSFANRLVSAPVYLEHISVPNAVGKVTSANWDGQNLWYEAEIYDDEVAAKIRKGLIQHVSIGADYETLDTVDGKIPHGLHNAELSLVAVPGIPETNVQIMEKIRGSLKEQCETCVFCGKNTAELWLASCFDCFGRLPIIESKRRELFPASVSAGQNAPTESEELSESKLKKFVEETVSEALLEQENREKARQAQLERSRKYGIGVKDGGNVTKPSEYEGISDEQFADPVNYRYPVNAEHVKGALSYFNQPGNRKAGGYTHEEQVKILTKIVTSALANNVEVSWQPDDPVYEGLPEELKPKLSGYEKENLAESLLRETPPKEAMVPVKDVVAIIESVLPPVGVERSWGLGPQRFCQEIHSVILKLKEESYPATANRRGRTR